LFSNVNLPVTRNSRKLEANVVSRVIVMAAPLPSIVMSVLMSNADGPNVLSWALANLIDPVSPSEKLIVYGPRVGVSVPLSA
jgi:hypothetical protein